MVYDEPASILLLLHAAKLTDVNFRSTKTPLGCTEDSIDEAVGVKVSREVTKDVEGQRNQRRLSNQTRYTVRHR